MATARDGCVVPTEPLAELLTGFVATWRTHRPPTAGQFAPRRERGQSRNDIPFVGPVDWLAQETALRGRRVTTSTIERIMGKRSTLTELRTADALVSAIGCPEVFYDGTLEIQPNPSATSTQRASCCGGSLTGAADPA